MKTSRLNQVGASHLIAVFVVLFVGVVSFAGYKVATMNQLKDNETATSAQSASVPASIKSKEDLAQTGKALDAATDDVDSSLNDSALDADLNDML